jgi:hypothetical protein
LLLVAVPVEPVILLGQAAAAVQVVISIKLPWPLRRAHLFLFLSGPVELPRLVAPLRVAVILPSDLLLLSAAAVVET